MTIGLFAPATRVSWLGWPPSSVCWRAFPLVVVGTLGIGFPSPGVPYRTRPAGNIERVHSDNAGELSVQCIDAFTRARNYVS